MNVKVIKILITNLFKGIRKKTNKATNLAVKNNNDEVFGIPDEKFISTDMGSVNSEWSLTADIDKLYESQFRGDDDERTVSFLSPRTDIIDSSGSGIVLDSGYDISDNGIEELTTAFLSEYPVESTTFVERLELLDNFLVMVQEKDAHPLKPILKKRSQSAYAPKRKAFKQQTFEQEFYEKFVRPYSAGTTGNNIRPVLSAGSQGRTVLSAASRGSQYTKVSRKETVEEEDIYESKGPDVAIEPLVLSCSSGKRMCVYNESEYDDSKLLVQSFMVFLFIFFYLHES